MPLIYILQVGNIKIIFSFCISFWRFLRLSNLENLVHALSQKIDNNKYYTDADIAGNRQSISNITPYTETKTAYYGEREKSFYDVPMGNITILFSNYNGNYSVGRIAGKVTVSFDVLNNQTDITISVL